MLDGHFVSMTVFALVISAMTACLKQERTKDILAFAGKMFLIMVGGGIAVSWIMFSL